MCDTVTDEGINKFDRNIVQIISWWMNASSSIYSSCYLNDLVSKIHCLEKKYKLKITSCLTSFVVVSGVN